MDFDFFVLGFFFIYFFLFFFLNFIKRLFWVLKSMLLCLRPEITWPDPTCSTDDPCRQARPEHSVGHGSIFHSLDSIELSASQTQTRFDLTRGQPYLKVCLVGAKSGWMENKEEKSGKKMVEVAIWLGGECGEKTCRPGVFLLEPTKTHFLQIVEIIGEKTFTTFFFPFFCRSSICFFSHQLWMVFFF